MRGQAYGARGGLVSLAVWSLHLVALLTCCPLLTDTIYTSTNLSAYADRMYSRRRQCHRLGSWRDVPLATLWLLEAQLSQSLN